MGHKKITPEQEQLVGKALRRGASIEQAAEAAGVHESLVRNVIVRAGGIEFFRPKHRPRSKIADHIRLHAAEMLKNGIPPLQIAKKLNINPGTIYNWTYQQRKMKSDIRSFEEVQEHVNMIQTQMKILSKQVILIMEKLK